MSLRSLVCGFVISLFISSGLAIAADDFAIEDPALGTLPKKVDAVIRGSAGFKEKTCELIGKSVNLTGKDASSGFVATTANACNWGAAVGPIWVVRNSNSPTVVLASEGYSLVLEKQVKSALRNVTISAATAGWQAKSLWKFDKKNYIKVKDENHTNK
ncbi:MAG: hypothetical protein ACHP7O_08035 [Burkholderiales bacterium]